MEFGSRSEERKSPEYRALGGKLAQEAEAKVADLTWALIDLGSLVCRPKSPRWSDCSLENACHYRREIEDA